MKRILFALSLIVFSMCGAWTPVPQSANPPDHTFVTQDKVVPPPFNVYTPNSVHRLFPQNLKPIGNAHGNVAPGLGDGWEWDANTQWFEVDYTLDSQPHANYGWALMFANDESGLFALDENPCHNWENDACSYVGKLHINIVWILDTDQRGPQPYHLAVINQTNDPFILNFITVSYPYHYYLPVIGR